LKKLTNTYKLRHRNEQNTKKISYLDMEEFHTPHAPSLYIFIYDFANKAKAIEAFDKIKLERAPKNPQKIKFQKSKKSIRFIIPHN
jgi:hypothetical protein